MTEAKVAKPLNGWWVFAAFCAFFGVIIGVNTVFITKALQSNTGLVREDAYKHGLDYNKTLEEARHQPAWKGVARFTDGVLTWSLVDDGGAVIDGAVVTGRFFRPVKDGDDFSVPLRNMGNGLYSVEPEFPFKGSWTVYLSATWNNQTFKTSENLVVK